MIRSQNDEFKNLYCCEWKMKVLPEKQEVVGQKHVHDPHRSVTLHFTALSVVPFYNSASHYLHRSLLTYSKRALDLVLHS